MSETRYYMVAGHRFGVTAETDDFVLMSNYEPFANHDDRNLTFTLTIGEGVAISYSEEMCQDDEGQKIVCGRTADGRPVFEYSWAGATAGWMICSKDYREGRLITTGRHRKLAIDNALMVIFSLATAVEGTVLFHAAAVSHKGRAYMFLGPSGTGKSTHARLWLKYIQSTDLVNDDNPVVRITDGKTMCYGSPWSGKTPCYRNESYPLGGIVMLSQAPYNKIRRLEGIEAYVALITSISGMRWDTDIADGLHQTENALVSTIGVWHLECLPDKEAAMVCSEKVIMNSDD